MLLFAVLLVTLLALLVSFILYVLSTANTNIAIAINILIPPPKIYLLHPFVSQISTRKLVAQSKRKTEKKTEKNKKITKKKTKQKTLGKLWLRHFPQGLGFLGIFFSAFSAASEIFLKKHFPLPAFGIHFFVRKRLFPKDFRQIILNFKLLSLKTGLFQRAVAVFLWRPDFFKGK